MAIVAIVAGTVQGLRPRIRIGQRALPAMSVCMEKREIVEQKLLQCLHQAQVSIHAGILGLR